MTYSPTSPLAARLRALRKAIDKGKPMRLQTVSERMHNLLFRFNGTASPAILPARRAILSILQSVRPTTLRDDVEAYTHFKTVRR